MAFIFCLNSSISFSLAASEALVVSRTSVVSVNRSFVSFNFRRVDSVVLAAVDMDKVSVSLDDVVCRSESSWSVSRDN